MKIKYIIYGLVLFTSVLFSQQINIPKIELMPKQPAPYVMRDWKEVSRDYDSFVFDLTKSGQYLPLVQIFQNTINYPEHNSFGLHSYVGTIYPNSAETINLLPAVIGASLCGIDKSNQNGYNWVLMCEEFFNKMNGEMIYLNSPSASSGDDWWYETMPNVFFYQLNYLYPNTGDFNFQFTSIANRWLEAVNKMGGSTTPWTVPNMNYRAWNLREMKPLDSGVREPEASGAIAWILYNAYIKTGDEKYRIGSELALEFLNSLNYNPSYEIQLPYGAYSAARMNAELGTNYNTEKIINWCFSNYLNRDWGTIMGNWGGYDIYGLIGEVNGLNDYAFLMNTIQQIGALVPLVRYDDRFARAIGKWVLNAANAARLFYPKYLPDVKQDSEEWAKQFDPDSYIAHEALRQSKYSTSPYATGDAIDGGWSATNLSLYSSSHVGILGGIIDTTNVEKILKLDCLKTDYYHNAAYPTFLFYNPYDVEKLVEFNIGIGQHDVYDAVTNKFLLTNQTGKILLTIPSDAAVLAVIIPSGGTVTNYLNQTLVNGVVIDCNSGNVVSNYPPRIKSLSAEKTILTFNSTTKIFCTIADKELDTLVYQWSATGGRISGTGDINIISWTAPATEGFYTIQCIVSDGKGGKDTSSVQIQVKFLINNPPRINKIKASPRKIDLGADTKIVCSAIDQDGDSLSYNWSANFGTITGKDSVISWIAPLVPGNYFINCVVTDINGGEALDSIGIEVRDFSNTQTGNLVLYFPFNGNANDASGNNNNGNVSGAKLTNDYFGNSNGAYDFNGIDNYIKVANNSGLNFQSSITVSIWIKVGQFYDREQYPISHGNWENRWKISITNKRIRWTLRTNVGVKDLDSETELISGKFYYVTCLYNGIDYELYINGELDAFTSFSGSINPTSYDLTIGQVLPNNNNYDFKGVLDEIRIYNFALSYPQIQELYKSVTPVEESIVVNIPGENILYQNYPNPFNPNTVISYQLSAFSHVTLKIYDVLGNEITTLANEDLPPGRYNSHWSITNGNFPSGIYFYRLTTNNYSDTKKFIILK
ncbi:MAG: T9SS type A sorting domain-containing protein [Ignavibacteriales bacterium]|nr:T9SS type A sorting domain-containing protein [Ignavibacteriales bacterium]